MKRKLLDSELNKKLTNVSFKSKEKKIKLINMDHVKNSNFPDSLYITTSMKNLNFKGNLKFKKEINPNEHNKIIDNFAVKEKSKEKYKKCIEGKMLRSTNHNLYRFANKEISPTNK